MCAENKMETHLEILTMEYKRLNNDLAQLRSLAAFPFPGVTIDEMKLRLERLKHLERHSLDIFKLISQQPPQGQYSL